MTNSLWFLERIKLTNMLGFYGNKEVIFEKGLQVIEAHNHTGKTSLATSLIWGLTGQLPSIDRITANQFKIKNKQAPDKHLAMVEIELQNKAGNKLVIQRATKSGIKTSSLSVCLDAELFEGESAEAVIVDQLGLKPRSMEGCCVVLRDQQQALIAGKQAESSEVIHDILGLSILSKLIPILKDKSKELKKLIDKYEGIDPIKKWEERYFQLKQELEGREQIAAQNGFNRLLFRSSQFLEEELAKLCAQLDISVGVDQSINDCISRIQQAIKNQQSRHPHYSRRLELQEQLGQVKQRMDKNRQSAAAFNEIRKKKESCENEHGMNLKAMQAELRCIELSIESKKSEIKLLHEKQGLFTHSLNLLSVQKELACCPLCQQSTAYEELLRTIRANTEDCLRVDLESREAELTELDNQAKGLYKLHENLHFLEKSSEAQLCSLLSALENSSEADKAEILWLEQAKHSNCLEKTDAILTKLDELNGRLEMRLHGLSQELSEVNDQISQLDARFGSLNQTLMDLLRYLLPVHDVQRKLLEHDRQRQSQESRSQAFQALLNRSNSYLADLERFKTSLQRQENEKAEQVIKEHESAISNFFAKVACNPHYDRVAISAKEDRGSIKYSFEVSSSENPKFTDLARHVLSGGDLSCACLGLMLSLTKGRANKSAFLMLDDPGECFDHIRIENFAREVQLVGGQQTIILTHQKHFADKLREHGASSVVF